MEKRWPKSCYFLLFTEACGTSREAGSCLHETVSAVRWLGISRISETHGFRATRRSLAALPLSVESSHFRANVSLLVSYHWRPLHACLLCDHALAPTVGCHMRREPVCCTCPRRTTFLMHDASGKTYVMYYVRCKRGVHRPCTIYSHARLHELPHDHLVARTKPAPRGRGLRLTSTL